VAVRTVIVDDERASREEIKLLLKKFPDFELLGEFDNAFDALSFIVSSTPDVTFFDINMPGFDGIHLAEVLKGIENPPIIVFITAYSEHAVKAFEVNAADYILKPIDEGRFAKTLSRISAKVKEKAHSDLNFVVCDFHGELILIKPEEVQYFYVEKGKLFIKKKAESLSVKSMNLQGVEKRFTPQNFFRINKEYIVNLNKISKIIPWFKGKYLIQMENGDKLPLSPHHQKEFKDRFRC
jgi:DNA-binding LytR/AlgR family response regulator